MRGVGWLLLVLILAVPAFSQSPEVDALLDAFMAKDIETAAKHLPPSFQKALAELPPAERTMVGQNLLLAQRLQRDGGKISRNETADVLLAIEENRGESKQRMEVRLDKKISDGYQAVLRLSARHNTEDFLGVFEAWMRYEDGEWRIYELTATDSHSLVNFDDPKLLEEIRGQRSNAGEPSAVGSLGSYNTAIVTYEATYPEIGVPESFDKLGPVGPGNEPTADHAGLLDGVLTAPPYQKSGYRFAYRAHASGSNDYTIIARPIEFGTTGKRSFFTDQTGVIRFTEEDREPTAEDPPLQ